MGDEGKSRPTDIAPSSAVKSDRQRLEVQEGRPSSHKARHTKKPRYTPRKQIVIKASVVECNLIHSVASAKANAKVYPEARSFKQGFSSLAAEPQHKLINGS